MLRACLLVLALLFTHDASAQAGAPTEDAVKAAYLSKLGNYVQWPAHAGPPANGRTVIGIVGAEEVANKLDQMAAVRDPLKGTVAVRRLRFDISLVSADKAGLRLSSQLLTLAATVIREKR